MVEVMQPWERLQAFIEAEGANHLLTLARISNSFPQCGNPAELFGIDIQADDVIALDFNAAAAWILTVADDKKKAELAEYQIALIFGKKDDGGFEGPTDGGKLQARANEFFR